MWFAAADALPIYQVILRYGDSNDLVDLLRPTLKSYHHFLRRNDHILNKEILSWVLSVASRLESMVSNQSTLEATQTYRPPSQKIVPYTASNAIVKDDGGGNIPIEVFWHGRLTRTSYRWHIICFRVKYVPFERLQYSPCKFELSAKTAWSASTCKYSQIVKTAFFILGCLNSRCSLLPGHSPLESD